MSSYLIKKEKQEDSVTDTWMRILVSHVHRHHERKRATAGKISANAC